jgi:ketosteroid isomerase-like protein
MFMVRSSRNRNAEEAPMDTATLAKDFTDLLKAGDFHTPGDRYWSEDVVSIEPLAEVPPSRGRDAVVAKGEWWFRTHEVHETRVEGPWVHGDQFAVRFFIDATDLETGKRRSTDEIGIYTVADGKVVEERYFYGQSVSDD